MPISAAGMYLFQRPELGGPTLLTAGQRSSRIALVRLGHLRQFVGKRIDHELEAVGDAQLGVD